MTATARGARPSRRRFDHDEARARYAAGETPSTLARAYGVSVNAMRCVLIPADYERVQAAGMSGTCIDCGNRCAKYRTGSPGVSDVFRCRACWAKTIATSVRESELQCIVCREWKPDADFPKNRNKAVRRFRHQMCRVCATTERHRYREATKVPCIECGEPRLPATPGNGQRGNDTGLCLTCYRASITKAAA